MKTAVAGIGAALAASACCIGPVVFSLLGVGALSAASLKLVPYRPWFIGFTILLVGVVANGFVCAVVLGWRGSGRSVAAKTHSPDDQPQQ
jgi:hypothetical protein